MPNFDKTGPGGKGPKTGRKMGACAGNQSKMGRGMGGCGRRLDLGQEEEMLKKRLEEIQEMKKNQN